MVFQVVAKLSRNFNIPRRERLKIQPLLVIPSPRSAATLFRVDDFRSLFLSLLLSSLELSSPPHARASFASAERFDGKSFAQSLDKRDLGPFLPVKPLKGLRTAKRRRLKSEYGIFL